MELSRPYRSLSTLAAILCVAFGLAVASYQPTVVLKHPVGTEHPDSLGNIISDSLARHMPFTATLYRIGMNDSVTAAATTNDSGLCAIRFDRWSRTSGTIDSASIARLDISFPNTWRATKTGVRFHFEPLRMERISLTGRVSETLVVVLPLGVTVTATTIGSGNFYYDFAVLADPHIAGGKKLIDGMEDFGTEGYDDTDNDPTEMTPEIEENIACREFIKYYLLGQVHHNVRFVVLAGDITQSSERSEYQRAREVFSHLSYFDNRPFIVPLMGNHDGWPYIGHGGVFEWLYQEQSAGSVVIGKYFLDSYRGVYDTLQAFLPAANWQASNLLSESTSVTGHTWPSFYNDFAFNYQGSKFIATDFCTRDKAYSGLFASYPGLIGYPETDEYEDWDYTWDWLHDQVDATPSGERLICLGHHPYYAYGAGYWRNWTADELHKIADAGLLGNSPVATSIGGHTHPHSETGSVTYQDDTICYYYALNTSSQGYLYVFRVRDSVQLEVSHEWGSPPSRTVQFNATYSYQGNGNASIENRWDFGDGSGFVYGQLQTSHEYAGVDHDTTYKVSLRVMTESGRHVWVCDTVQVSPTYDVCCIAISAPLDTIHWGSDVVPSAVTYNNGSCTESYAVRMRIVNDADSVVYDTTASVSGHEPQDTKLVTFPTWHADVQGDYAVACSTELASDGVPANDKLTDTCRVLYPHDASADNITSASRVGYYEWLVPWGVVTNHYDGELTFWVKFVIEGVYADSHQVTMMPGSQGESFDSIREINPGTYDTKLIVRLDGDDRPANDTFSAQLLVVDDDYWVRLNALPATTEQGFVLVEGPDAGQSVYAVRLDGSNFAKYSVASDQWNDGGTPSSSPLATHYSADRYGDFIYVLGTYGPRTAIARYAIGANRWDTLTTSLPSGAAQNGGIFARHSDTLYVLLRNTMSSFWRYVVTGRSWTWLGQDPPQGSYGVAASTYDGSGLIHVLQVTQNSRGILQTYSIGSGQWVQSETLDNALASGCGIAITTVSGRNSVFALWPTSNVTPGVSSFDEYNLSSSEWTPCWPYFDSIGPHPSMTSRDGLPYAACGVPQAAVHTFGRYYPAPLAFGGEGVCADAGPRVTEYGLNSEPNPFTHSTTIRWQVPKATRALVAVYDVQGRLVKEIRDGNFEPGRYSQVWNTQGMPAGVYLCSFTSSERRMTQRLILMK